LHQKYAVSQYYKHIAPNSKRPFYGIILTIPKVRNTLVKTSNFNTKHAVQRLRWEADL
jgi:hypothetical protein